MTHVRARAVAIATAAAAALAFAATAGAQDAEDEAGDAAAGVACGVTFAASGARSATEYAGGQLRACDALVAGAHTKAELESAASMLRIAHAGVLEQWRAVSEDLIAAASAPVVVDAAGETVDPYAEALARRDAVETGMDGLRILLRLTYKISNTFADPARVVAALEGDDAAHAPEALASRRVCASSGRASRQNQPGIAPSWFFFADGVEAEYEVEEFDPIAERAEDLLLSGLEAAPSLGVTRLRSFVTKADCALSRFPSERDAS